MKIRADLEGVVYAHAGEGVVCLSAGDAVPDGVEVGEHVTEKESTSGSAGRGRGRGSASRPPTDG